jgi:hypothetical protein
MAEIIVSGRDARELRGAINKCRDKPTTVTFDKENIIFDCEPIYPKRRYEILGLKPPEKIVISTCQAGSGHTLTPSEEGVTCIRFDWFNVPEGPVKICNVLPKDITGLLQHADKVKLIPAEKLEAIFSDYADNLIAKATIGDKCPERLLRTMGGIVEIPLPAEET